VYIKHAAGLHRSIISSVVGTNWEKLHGCFQEATEKAMRKSYFGLSGWGTEPFEAALVNHNKV
jgi:hypothetical protein